MHSLHLHIGLLLNVTIPINHSMANYVYKIHIKLDPIKLNGLVNISFNFSKTG